MKKELIAYKEPKSPVAETFRTLRTNIQFMNTRKNLQAVLVTSTMPGEGKSWVSANLATTFAQAGKKTVIIDADLRKGRQNKIFSIDGKPGLSNYLLEARDDETTDIFKYVRKTDVENLYLITNGSVPPNPSELLASEVMANTMKKLREYFDILILDGTPSLIVTDAVIVSRLVDTTIIVAEYNATKKDNLLKVKRSFESVGASIAGVVLNKEPVNPKKYENSYYYGTSETKNDSGISRRNKKASHDEGDIEKQIDNYYKNK